jgi:putative tryptophan/tyrosine transport system substrate-binding protein
MWRSTVECIVTLTLSLLAIALAATAQPTGKVPQIGWLTTGVPSAGVHALLEAFRQGLRDLGYVEGRNILVESRYAEGHEDRCPVLAAELVRLPVDVLVAAGTAPIQAAQHATSTIPIVMAWGTDPVAQGFVASLSRPEGNITGLSSMSHDLLGKQLELLTQMVPTALRIAFLTDPVDPANGLQVHEVQRVAQALGVQLHVPEARSLDDLQRVFAALPREGVHALLLNRSRPEIAALALQRRLPAMYNGRLSVEGGGLMSYGSSQPDMHYRAAYYVDRLLKGTPPAELPVEQPRKFELVLNLKTAQALGLTIPPHLLILADEVIR